MTAHVIDSALFKDQFGTARMRAVFDDRHLVQCWMDVEAALARAEAAVGIIPAEAARAITETAQHATLDFDAIKQQMDETIHPLVGFVRVFSQACPGGAGEYVHWGATSQDIMDTACVVQLREALTIVSDHLDDVIGVLARLAFRFRDTPMAGRTHGQHALPVTLGFKLAILIAEFQRHAERLRQLRPRLLVTQLSGAVGTMASLDGPGAEVQESFAQELSLKPATAPWHTARDAFAEFACVSGMIGATCAKAAQEVILLQKTEVAELEEHNTEAHVGSSTMPQKRNPMMCEAVVSLGRILRQQSALALDCMVQAHERDMATWQAEWEFIPETAILLSGALDQTYRIYRDLSVRPEKMKRNLDLTGGLINAESVMMNLAPHLGRERAHDLVGTAARKSFETGRPFLECLLGEPEIRTVLDEATISALLQPAAYLGQSTRIVDRVLALAQTETETTTRR